MLIMFKNSRHDEINNNKHNDENNTKNNNINSDYNKHLHNFFKLDKTANKYLAHWPT